MPRVPRNYQHTDFSYMLLPQQKEPPAPVPANSKKAKTVSQAKRRRDSLMSDQKKKYVLHKATGEIHDRDCPLAAEIPDKNFDMLEELPPVDNLCPKCKRMAYIRNGLAFELNKYARAALRICDNTHATTKDLHTLFVDAKAQVYQVQQNRIYLKVAEDRWIIESEEGSCFLYHNNYLLTANAKRLITDGFHLQTKEPTSFHYAVFIMTSYDWEGHLKGMAEQRKEKLLQKLIPLRHYERISKHSLLFHYYHVADADNYLKNAITTRKIHAKIQKNTRYNGKVFTSFICKVPRWRVQSFLTEVESIKTYVADRDHSGFIGFTNQIFANQQ